MDLSSSTTLPNGVYRIRLYNDQEQILTRNEDTITVAALNAQHPRSQQWRVAKQANGRVSIQNPADIFPSSSLAYDRDGPGKAKEGQRIVPGSAFNFPTREWKLEVAVERPPPTPYLICVPDQELIVVLSPVLIEPPQLVLAAKSHGLDKTWVFELVHSN